MKKRKTALIVIAVVVGIIGLAALAIAYYTSDVYEEDEALRKEALVKYRYSSGGDMNGSHHFEEIEQVDDTHAVISIFSAEWYADDGKVSEYLADVAVLREIEAIFRKNHMNRWAHQTISRMFVADGASYSYDFWFGDTSIGFTSQVYPARYRKPLNEIDEVIEKYKATAERLPGLVLPEKSGEEEYDIPQPKPGSVTLEVYKYCGGTLFYRLLNGTADAVTIPGRCRVISAETGGEITVIDSEYKTEQAIEKDGRFESYARLEERLRPGSYRLEDGAFSVDFEIR